MKFRQLCVWSMLLTIMVLSGGCGGLVSTIPPLNNKISGAERDFAAALHYLRNGNEAVARDLLGRVVEESVVIGVADEALFRLALLTLRDEDGRGERRAIELFDTLLSKYPKSIWSRQAAPLVSYVRENIALRARTRELRSLKTQNLSLGRDNKELRQSLERLKNLDLELEQKIRR